MSRSHPRRLLVGAACLSLLGACECISPSMLKGFACEADGGCGLEGFVCCPDAVCRLECGAAAPDGSSPPDAGEPSDAGDADAGSLDAGEACGPATCEGCCEGPICRTGATASACGSAGAACQGCDPIDQRCVAGACQTLLANGSGCSEASECVSGHCVEGNCCESACSGVCGTCKATGSEGRCGPRPEGTAAASCAPFACDGVNPDCPAACTTIRQCSSGRYCDSAGQCLALKANGPSCSASTECASGLCIDGVCCDGPCSGSCDRCNLSGQVGQCKPAPADDPGSPACGAQACNGTLPDCPILCATGCPAGTYCSGTYCSAKKTLGLPCGGDGECSSGLCVDAVCCNTGCAGECAACSVAEGAPSNGICTLLGAAKVCRAAVNTCDLAERCTGTDAGCPPNAFAAASTTCGTTLYGSWSLCGPPPGLVCSLTGSQARSRTDSLCDGAGSCRTDAGTETAACSRSTENTSCGTISYGSFSACSYADPTCSTTGTRTRSKTEPLCQSGSCQQLITAETDTAGCARTTEDTACGAVNYGTWTSCSYAQTCSAGGTRSRDNTGLVCKSGSCQQATATETDTTACARNQDGQSCGSTSTGAWSSCSYGSSCASSGSRTRQVITAICDSGSCGTVTTTETDTAGCARDTTGTTCQASTLGPWSSCTAPTGACSGSRSRIRVDHTCASESCSPLDVPETETCQLGEGDDCSTTCYCLLADCTSYRRGCIGGVCTQHAGSMCGSCGGGSCIPQ